MSEQDRMDTETTRIIDEYGHQVIGVFPTEDAPGVPFAYTVGRTAKGRPELLIVGPLPFPIQGTLLNDAARIDDERGLEPGAVVDDLLQDDLTVVMVEADPQAGEMFQALHFYQGEDVRALQLVWPDSAGRHPWDEGYDLAPEVQPVHRKEAS